MRARLKPVGDVSFRELAQAIEAAGPGTDLARSILTPWLPTGRSIIEECDGAFQAGGAETRDRDLGELSWELYALSRVMDLLIGIVGSDAERERTGLHLDIDDYAGFMVALGFRRVFEAVFHPSGTRSSKSNKPQMTSRRSSRKSGPALSAVIFSSAAQGFGSAARRRFCERTSRIARPSTSRIIALGVRHQIVRTAGEAIRNGLRIFAATTSSRTHSRSTREPRIPVTPPRTT